MLCSLCKKIRPPHLSAKGKYDTKHTCIFRHHANYDALLESARSGCQLCKSFSWFVEKRNRRDGGPSKEFYGGENGWWGKQSMSSFDSMKKSPEAKDHVLKWLEDNRDEPLAAEQLWVGSFFFKVDMPNYSQNGITAQFVISSGSLEQHCTWSDTFCYDGVHLPGHKELAAVAPSLWVFKSDNLSHYREERRDLLLPVFEFFVHREKMSQLSEDFFISGTEEYPILARDIQKDATSSQSVEIANEWLSVCRDYHPICKSALRGKGKPSRLLDVGTNQKPHLRLIDGDRCDVNEGYVALSHCWGPFTTTITRLVEKDHAQWNENIEEATIIRNFRDAVTVCRNLNFKYLWIDAMCIIQDSPADWAREAPKMGQYFSFATVVISALASPNASHGILHDRHLDDGAIPAFHIDTGLFIRPVPENPLSVMDSKFRGENWFRKPIFDKPLKLRSWTTQELLFAVRTIHFSSQQMIWQCRTFTFAEDSVSEDLLNEGPADYSENGEILVFQKALYPDERRDFESTNWFTLLSLFTSRHITFASDRLPAISSLAKEISLATGLKYCAGIWFGDVQVFLTSLLWQLQKEGDVAFPPEYAKGCENAPSWSWASLIGCTEDETTFIRSAANDLHLEAKFGEPVVHFATEDKFGAVLPGAYIPVEAWLFHFRSMAAYTDFLVKNATVSLVIGEEQERQTKESAVKEQFLIFDVPAAWKTADQQPLGKSEDKKPSPEDYKLDHLDLHLMSIGYTSPYIDHVGSFVSQIFLLLQKLPRAEGETGLHRYRRVGRAKPPDGLTFDIGNGFGWRKESFHFC